MHVTEANAAMTDEALPHILAGLRRAGAGAGAALRGAGRRLRLELSCTAADGQHARSAATRALSSARPGGPPGVVCQPSAPGRRRSLTSWAAAGRATPMATVASAAAAAAASRAGGWAGLGHGVRRPAAHDGTAATPPPMGASATTVGRVGSGDGSVETGDCRGDAEQQRGSAGTRRCGRPSGCGRRGWRRPGPRWRVGCRRCRSTTERRVRRGRARSRWTLRR